MRNIPAHAAEDAPSNTWAGTFLQSAALEVSRNRAEHAADLIAGDSQPADRDESDERNDQRVLDQRLTLIAPKASPDVCEQHLCLLHHVFPPFSRRLPRRRLVDSILVLTRSSPPQHPRKAYPTNPYGLIFPAIELNMLPTLSPASVRPPIAMRAMSEMISAYSTSA